MSVFEFNASIFSNAPIRGHEYFTSCLLVCDIDWERLLSFENTPSPSIAKFSNQGESFLDVSLVTYFCLNWSCYELSQSTQVMAFFKMTLPPFSPADLWCL